MSTRDISRAESRVVLALNNVAFSWPNSLWLYAGAGSLHIMQKGPGGARMMLPGGGVDPAYSICAVGIPCDGGDW